MLRQGLSTNCPHTSLLASAPVVWWTNADGDFVEEQPQWRDYTGQAWDEYRGTGWASCLHPDDCPSIMADWASAIASGLLYSAQGRIWSAKHKGYRAFQTHGVPLRNERGEIERWLGALTDVQDIIEMKVLLDRTQIDLARGNAKNGAPAIKPLIVRPSIGRKMLGGCGTEKFWDLLNTGEIKSYLDGRARYVVVESLEEYVARKVAQPDSKFPAPRPEAHYRRGNRRQKAIGTLPASQSPETRRRKQPATTLMRSQSNSSSRNVTIISE